MTKIQLCLKTEETSHPEEDASTAEDGAITLETARKEEGVAPALGTIQEDIDIRVLVQGADTTIDTITQDLQADLDLVPVTRYRPHAGTAPQVQERGSEGAEREA